MKWSEAVAIFALFILVVLAGALLLERGGLVSERDALQEEVRALQREVVTVTNFATEINKRWLVCLGLDGVPPDTTKKFVRPRDISGMDTMPVIESCSLFIRSGR